MAYKSRGRGRKLRLSDRQLLIYDDMTVWMLQILMLLPIPQNGGFVSRKFALLEENFPTKKQIVRQSKILGQGIAPPPPRRR